MKKSTPPVFPPKSSKKQVVKRKNNTVDRKRLEAKRQQAIDLETEQWREHCRELAKTDFQRTVERQQEGWGYDPPAWTYNVDDFNNDMTK